MPKAKLRGGFRYLTLFLGSRRLGRPRRRDAAVHAGPDRVKPRDYPNYFRSNDDLLNKLWYAGAYTVQTNTIAPDTGRSGSRPETGLAELRRHRPRHQRAGRRGETRPHGVAR